MIWIYGIVIFLATALGATTGAGGGAIIKPVFDLIGVDSVATIGIYSTIAVFSMCLSSLYKHRKSGQGFDSKIMLTLSVGSLLGGYIGEQVFKKVVVLLDNNVVTRVQSFLLLFVLITVLLFTIRQSWFPKFEVKNKWTIFSFGMGVGALSVFLGIGGGPLNIIVLLGFMSMTAKESTPYSIGMIFFAQVPKILMIVMKGSSVGFNIQMVPIIIITAIGGGYFGTKINHLLKEKQVSFMYSFMMTLLLITCSVNIIKSFL